MYERARLERRVITPSSAAAATVLDFGPAEGEIWRVVACNGQHDDPAAHSLNFVVVMGALVCEVTGSTSTAQYAKRVLYNDWHYPEQIMLGYGDILRLNSVDAMAAGKKLYAYAVIEVLRGVVVP